MRVKELIELLKRCPQDNIVLYDMENSLKNESYVTRNDNGENFIETIMGIDDVLIGSGTLKGFVYLVEEKYEIQKETSNCGRMTIFEALDKPIFSIEELRTLIDTEITVLETKKKELQREIYTSKLEVLKNIKKQLNFAFEKKAEKL